jgi:hypothetical protein
MVKMDLERELLAADFFPSGYIIHTAVCGVNCRYMHMSTPAITFNGLSPDTAFRIYSTTVISLLTLLTQIILWIANES